MTDIEKAIVDFARVNDALPEFCILCDYDPDIGRVEPYWKPTVYSVMLFQAGVDYKNWSTK